MCWGEARPVQLLGEGRGHGWARQGDPSVNEPCSGQSPHPRRLWAESVGVRRRSRCTERSMEISRSPNGCASLLHGQWAARR